MPIAMLLNTENSSKSELYKSLLECIVSNLCVYRFLVLISFPCTCSYCSVSCGSTVYMCVRSTLCPLCVCLCVRIAIAVCCRWVVCTQVAPVVASNICFGVVVPLGCFSIGFPQAGPKAVTSARLC